MPNPVEGIDPASLDPVHRRALAILTAATPGDLSRLKHEMHIGFPAVVGVQTVEGFVKLCAERHVDLTPEGVAAFKASHHLDDTGPNAGAIGPTTAAVYVDTILAAAPPLPPSAGRHVTRRGLQIVENFEGFRSTAYLDKVGVPTIGWGHTAGVRMGQVATVEQCEAWLRADLAIVEAAIARLVKVALNDNQFDALASFAFNVGTGALASSGLLRLLNAGDYAGAAAQFPRWCKGTINGQLTTIGGLLRRRNEERALFERPVA